MDYMFDMMLFMDTIFLIQIRMDDGSWRNVDRCYSRKEARKMRKHWESELEERFRIEKHVDIADFVRT